MATRGVSQSEESEHAPVTPTAPGLRPASVAPRSPTTPSEKPRTYTVRAGDSLWSISQQFGVTVSELARANRLAPDAALQVGQQLVIPSLAGSVGIPLPRVRDNLAAPARADLVELAPDLVQYLRGRVGSSAAAVYVPASDTLYTYNPTERFQLASVVKVPIMLTELDRVRDSGSGSTLPETDLLRPMITYSDNAAATALLAEVGGPPAVEVALAVRGVSQTDVNPDAWGLSTSTAPDMALLLRSLYMGEGLNEPLRAIAFRLMGGVVAEQRWGVPAGLPAGSPVAFKGGWLPRGQGWLVHQVGLAVLDGEPVVFAFLNKGQPTFEYGKATLRRSGMYLAAETGGK
ncbi:MAG: serine hydrolase [Chloroflexota bacterium]|nr:serine hydrolase [Chloroflexota bacterium]